MSSDEMAELLAAVANRDSAAFERLYQKTSAKLHGVILRILRRHDVAADVLEEAYRKIWEDAGTYEAKLGSPIVWMLASARRLAIEAARRPGVAIGEAEPEISDSERPGPLPRREMTEDLKRLLTCIGRLEPDHQRMVLLAYYGAFSRAQLAEKLGTPVDLLRASLRRSLFEIDQCLNS
jgi:RNA polymerase sigma-70 factor (ECF subfamily)